MASTAGRRQAEGPKARAEAACLPGSTPLCLHTAALGKEARVAPAPSFPLAASAPGTTPVPAGNYEFYTGQWSACPPCGPGSQSRTVYCQVRFPRTHPVPGPLAVPVD